MINTNRTTILNDLNTMLSLFNVTHFIGSEVKNLMMIRQIIERIGQIVQTESDEVTKITDGN